MKPIALIVEDREEIALIWKRNLTPLEFEIWMAHSLAEAMEMMNKIPPPALVLLDLGLGDSSAMHTAESISLFRKLNPKVVIMVISGLITEELAQVALSQGAAAILQKLEMQAQSDLWHAIKGALAQAPSETQNIFTYPLQLIDKLTKVLTPP